ncbi:MAG: S46 family peptidase [Candidatus Taylorbacteria bacterium]|nr:S46 family peptidase [Candidatus Taylorbacteria bacterium]
MKLKIRGFLLALAIVVGGSFVLADEGMWLLNNLPVKQIKDKYGLVRSSEWIEHVQYSSVRLPNCSASFVSTQGLLMTNWHCAEKAVKALSTLKNNYYKNGFYARTLSDELKTNLNVRVLMTMDDVTGWVNDLTAQDKGGNIAMARQSAIKEIQKRVSDMYALTCEVAVLYQGGQYHNYCYRVYNDVRLVFMPERNVGFFGGDADNFEYPRYTLDVAFLRAYENGKPAKTPFHFKWSKSGAKEGELIFASGHPGRTARLLTSDALRTERDIRVPFLLDLFRRRELTTQQFMIRGKEQRRVAESDLFSWQNSRKLYAGKIRGLQDPHLIEDKSRLEGHLIAESSQDSTLAQQLDESFKLVDEAQSAIREIYPRYALIVRGLGFDSRLYRYAASIASGNQELAKSVLEARQSEEPLNLEYEEARLRDSLTHLVEILGVDGQLIVGIMGGRHSPSTLAHYLVYNTVLVDIDQHKSIISGAPRIQVIDPMIELARFMSVYSQEYSKKMNEAAEKERAGYAKISDVKFKLYGTDQYPDATFTLRLTFGKMSGYQENGKSMPPFTTIGGAYRHSSEFGNAGDYKLPLRWWKRKQFVNLKTPLNFVSDVDITGGNSGSPVFNKELEIVGLIFDSNIQGLVSDYDYNYAPEARAIAVHSAGILELLSKVYRADRLVRELTRN